MCRRVRAAARLVFVFGSDADAVTRFREYPPVLGRSVVSRIA